MSALGTSLLNAVTGRRHAERLPEPIPSGAVSVSARNINVTLGGSPILREVDLTVRSGEVRALIGPNGAGKSTLLGVLTGDHTPESGTVEIAGRNIRSWRSNEIAMRRAVMTQDVMLSFPFTVREVVAMGRSPWRGTAAEDNDEAIVTESLAATDVEHLAPRQFTTLSGGEKARVALSRILAQRTHLLMLDEPTAALDLRHQELVLELARNHARAGGSVIVVVHDIGLAAAYSDEVTILDGGRVVGDGTPHAVLTPELLSSVYQYPIDVIDHPEGGAPIILPRRR